MSYTLEFTKQYHRDLAAVEAYYEKEQPGLGDRFLDDVDEALDKLETHPAAFARVRYAPARRRIILGKFPYILYFRVIGRKVRVNRCYSTHRKPLYPRPRRK